MFKKVTKFIVNQVDPSKDLVPVESIANHEHFRPYCLLKRKIKRNMFHPAPYFQQTGFRLDDVLLPGEDGKSTESVLPNGDVQDSSQFTLTKDTASHVDAAASCSLDRAGVGIEGGVSLSRQFSIKPQKKGVPLCSLDALSSERQINMDHSFIQQFQKSNFNLYVVYETLETSEEVIYKESTKAGGGTQLKYYVTFSTKGTRDNKQGLHIPKGCTLAFRAIKLYISNGKWGPDYFAGENRTSLEFFGPPQGKLQELCREVELHCAVFSELSSGLLVMLLNTITAVMRDSKLFEELRQKVEKVEETDGYELKTESPDLKDLLSTLEKSPRIRSFRLAKGITYVLDALAELLEDQLLLLLKSLEREIVPQQLKLVGQLLEHNLEEWNEPFCVDASLLSFPRQEEQSFTMDLVELSGVKLQEDGSAVPIEQPLEAVAALYIALYVLNLLSGTKQVAPGPARGTNWEISAHKPLLFHPC